MIYLQGNYFYVYKNVKILFSTSILYCKCHITYNQLYEDNNFIKDRESLKDYYRFVGDYHLWVSNNTEHM